jgi:hypothetical protein
MLVDILSIDQNVNLSVVIQDHVLKLRLVNKRIKNVLESNPFLIINIRINDAGVESLTADFLQRWRGKVNLSCTRLWNADSTWFNECRNALLSGRLRPLSLLSLSVAGNDLALLAELLVVIAPAIQQLIITYQGTGKSLIAAVAPLASIGRSLTMEISAEEKDSGGILASTWLQHLRASSIRLGSVSLRSIHCTAMQMLLPRHRILATAAPRGP